MAQIPNVTSSGESAVRLAIEFLKSKEVWMNTDESIMFKATLPGTNLEDLKIQTDEDAKLLKITRVLPAWSEDGDEAVNEFLMACFTNGEILRAFSLPEGVKNPKEFKTSMDQDGVLTVTFNKLKPKKKLVSKVLGVLGKAVPGFAVVGAKMLYDYVSGNNEE